MMFSRFECVVVSASWHRGISLLCVLLSDAPLCQHTIFSVFPLSVDGCLCCFHLLTILYNEAKSIHFHIFVQTCALISFEYIDRKGICGSYHLKFCVVVIDLKALRYQDMPVLASLGFSLHLH